MKKMGQPHLCPICHKFEFPFSNSYAICEVCGWMDDRYQEQNPDEDCLANRMSLNEARKAYSEGREIE